MTPIKQHAPLPHSAKGGVVPTPFKQASLSLSLFLNTVPPVRLGLRDYPSQDPILIEPERRDFKVQQVQVLKPKS